PIAGVLVSLFGKGLREGGLVLLSDSSGRFVAPSVPAGSYTIRALGQGRALTQRITVLPNQDSIFTLSFAGPQRPDRETALEDSSTNDRELKWLLRHKRRSVLETRNVDAEDTRVAEALGRTGNLLE